MFILQHGTWKDNIRSVNFDWKRDPMVTHAKGWGPLVFQAKGEIRWSLKQTCQLCVRVLRPLHYFTKRVPVTEERYVRTLSDSIPTYTQSSPSKNKNINYTFTYLRIFRYLSSGAIYDIFSAFYIFMAFTMKVMISSDICLFSNNLLSRFTGPYHRYFWGCVDQCIISQIFHLFLCDILPALPEIVKGISVNNRFLLSSVLSRLSTSQVNTLLLYSCGVWVLHGDFFGSVQFCP